MEGGEPSVRKRTERRQILPALRRTRSRRPDAPGHDPPAHGRALAVYTAATIVLGFGALALATLTIPLDAHIALPFPGGRSTEAGLGLWVVFGLAGAARIIRNPSGQGVLTFHLPFIVAAMALGGPVAAAWVGMLSTFDRRELEEAPWYGIAANHAAFALAAVVGGLGLQAVREVLGPAGTLPAAELLAIFAGTTVFTFTSVALAVGTIVLRSGLTGPEAIRLFNGAYRRTTLAEMVLGWLLALVYVQVDWWAPILLSAIVLALWQANADRGRLSVDSLTGLLNRDGFRARVEEATRLAARGGPGGALAFLDLNAFGELNHRIGFRVADEILVEVGRRLGATIRASDAAARLMGDEFAVLFPGVADEGTALRLAGRIHAALAAPYETSIGTVAGVSGSVGVVLYRSGDAGLRGADVERRAAGWMFRAKQRGTGVELERPEPVAQA